MKDIKIKMYCIVLGVSMGWLCIHHQPDSPTCVPAPDNGKVLSETVCQLHRVLHRRTAHVHADPLRRIPADPD